MIVVDWIDLYGGFPLTHFKNLVNNWLNVKNIKKHLKFYNDTYIHFKRCHYLIRSILSVKDFLKNGGFCLLIVKCYLSSLPIVNLIVAIGTQNNNPRQKNERSGFSNFFL